MKFIRGHRDNVCQGIITRDKSPFLSRRAGGGLSKMANYYIQKGLFAQAVISKDRHFRPQTVTHVERGYVPPDVVTPKQNKTSFL